MAAIIYLLRSSSHSFPACLYSSDDHEITVLGIEDATGTAGGAVLLRRDNEDGLQSEFYSYERVLEILLSGGTIITL